MQTKTQSFIEAIMNVAIDFFTTMAFSPLIYWICDVKLRGGQMWSVTTLFTILSVVRSYVLRRFFNKRHRPKEAFK